MTETIGAPSTNSDDHRQIVLSSSSPFRKALLQRLGLEFSVASPEIDESSSPGESPEALVVRLAEAKARAVAPRYPTALIIGSDQVACIDGRILGKPGSRTLAVRQLEQASGKRVTFFTGLCLLDSVSGRIQSVCEPFLVHFRQLSREQIERYLDTEEPYDCAGSFKSEGLGISLFQRLEGDDPNALIGLPLIQLVRMLGAVGIELP